MAAYINIFFRGKVGNSGKFRSDANLTFREENNFFVFSALPDAQDHLWAWSKFTWFQVCLVYYHICDLVLKLITCEIKTKYLKNGAAHS